MSKRHERKQAARESAKQSQARSRSLKQVAAAETTRRAKAVAVQLGERAAAPMRVVEPERPRANDSSDREGLEYLIHLYARERAPGKLPYRDELEQLFCTELDDVRAYLGVPAVVASLGAVAAAEGNIVAFADHAPSRARVAHEVAHVLQARRSRGEGGPEVEAEAIEAYVTRGLTRAIEVRSTAQGVQRKADDEPFDPHEYIRTRAHSLPSQLWGALYNSHVLKAAQFGTLVWGREDYERLEREVPGYKDLSFEEFGRVTKRLGDVPQFYEKLIRGMTADPEKRSLHIDHERLAELLAPASFVDVVSRSAVPSDNHGDPHDVRQPILWDIANVIAERVLDSIPRMVPRCIDQERDYREIPAAHPIDRAVAYALTSVKGKPRSSLRVDPSFEVIHPELAKKEGSRVTKAAQIEPAGNGLWHWVRAKELEATREDVALTLFGSELEAHRLIPAPPLFAWLDRDWDRIVPEYREPIAAIHPDKILANKEDFEPKPKARPCNVRHHRTSGRTYEDYEKMFAELDPPDFGHDLTIDGMPIMQFQQQVNPLPPTDAIPIWKIPHGDPIAELNGVNSRTAAVGSEQFAASRPRVTKHDHVELVGLLDTAIDLLSNMKGSMAELDLDTQAISERWQEIRRRQGWARRDELPDVDRYYEVFKDQVGILGQIAYGFEELCTYVVMYAPEQKPFIQIMGRTIENPLAKRRPIDILPELVVEPLKAAGRAYADAVQAMDVREVARERLGRADALTRNVQIEITEIGLREIAPGIEDAIKTPNDRHKDTADYDPNEMKYRAGSLRGALGKLRIQQIYDPVAAAQPLAALQSQASDLQFEATVVNCLEALDAAWKVIRDQQDFWSSMKGTIDAHLLKEQNRGYYDRFKKDVFELYVNGTEETKQQARNNFKDLADDEFKLHFKLVQELIEREAEYKRWAKLAAAIAISIVSMGVGSRVGAFLIESALWGRAAATVGAAAAEMTTSAVLSKVVLNQDPTLGGVVSQLSGNVLAIGMLQKMQATGRAAGFSDDAIKASQATLFSKGVRAAQVGIVEGTMGLFQAQLQNKIDRGEWIPADQLPDLMVDNAIQMLAISVYRHARSAKSLKADYGRIDRKLSEVYDERMRFADEVEVIKKANDRKGALELSKRMRKNFEREAVLHEQRARATAAHGGDFRDATNARKSAEQLYSDAQKAEALIGLQNIGPNLFVADPHAIDTVLALQRTAGGKVTSVRTDSLGIRVIEIKPAQGPPITLRERVLPPSERGLPSVPPEVAQKFEDWLATNPTVLPGHTKSDNDAAVARLRDYYIRDPAGAVTTASKRLDFETDFVAPARDPKRGHEDARLLGDERATEMLPQDFAAMEKGGYRYDPVARAFERTSTFSGAGVRVDTKLDTKAHVAIGKPAPSLAVGQEMLRMLAMGDAHALRVIGVEPPPNFNSQHNEWGLGKRKNRRGEIEYIIVRGDLFSVDWGKLPGVEALAHTHPYSDSKFRQIGGKPEGTITLDVLLKSGSRENERLLIFPSGADFVYLASRGISNHRVMTGFVFLGYDHYGQPTFGNPRPGGLETPIEFEVNNPQLLDGSDAMGAAYAEGSVILWAGDIKIWEGKITGGHLGNYMPLKIGGGHPPDFVPGKSPATPDTTPAAPAKIDPNEIQRVAADPRLPKPLRDLILNDARVTNALHNEGYNVDRLLVAWDQFKGARSPSKKLQSKSFEEYLYNRKDFRTTIGEPSPKLDDVIPKSKKSVRARQEYIFKLIEPRLAAAVNDPTSALPKVIRTKIKAVLQQDLFGGVTTLDGARYKLTRSINEIIGTNVGSRAEFIAALQLVSTPGSYGSIGEHYTGSKLVSNTYGPNDLVSQRIPQSDIPGLTVDEFIPDRIVLDANRTLDIKTGYAKSAIDLDQAANYKRLREATKSNPALASRLGGELLGHDYLILPGADPSKTPAEVAAREYDRLAKAPGNLLDDTRVLFQGDDGAIYEYKPTGTSKTGYKTIHEAMGLEEPE